MIQPAVEMASEQVFINSLAYYAYFRTPPASLSSALCSMFTNVSTLRELQFSHLSSSSAAGAAAAAAGRSREMNMA
jgi:hypothetical protein